MNEERTGKCEHLPGRYYCFFYDFLAPKDF